MKLPAMLKDSLREAVDRKIFAVMLVLGGLLTLFVASISYRAITPEDDLRTILGFMSWGFKHNPQYKNLDIRIEDFHQTNAPAEPWRGDYQFDWIVQADDLENLPEGPPISQDQIRQFVKSLRYLNAVEVSEDKSDDENLARFTVTTHGTNVDDFLGWRFEPKILFAIPLPFWHTSIRDAVYFVEDKLVDGVGAWVAVLIGVIITASFVPNLLQKGAIDLWLSKPIRRPVLLVYKYLGGLIFVFLITTATVLGVWTAIGLRSGLWTPGFLVVIPAVTFYFALLYSVSTLTAVLTRSTVVAILCTLAVWFGLWLNGTVHAALDTLRQERAKAGQMVRAAAGGEEQAVVQGNDAPPGGGDLPHWVYSLSDGLYKVLPRTRDLDNLTAICVGRGLLNADDQKKLETAERPPWWETVGVTVAFIGVMLGLACWRFSRADY